MGHPSSWNSKDVLVHPLDQKHLFVVVDLAEFYFNDFPAAGGHVPAYVGSLDGLLAMAAIDEYRQLHAARTAVVKKRIQSGSYRAAGVENVIA